MQTYWKCKDGQHLLCKRRKIDNNVQHIKAFWVGNEKTDKATYNEQVSSIAGSVTTYFGGKPCDPREDSNPQGGVIRNSIDLIQLCMT